MRIPTSVFVMGALTCVPFGLAIRDSVKAEASERDAWGGPNMHGLANHDDDDDLIPEPDRDNSDSGARLQAEADQAARDRIDLEQARVAADQARAEERVQNAARDRLLPLLLGAKPGALGLGFRNLAMGQKLDDVAYEAFDHISLPNLRVSAMAPNDVLDGVSITATSNEVNCEELTVPAKTVWGEPHQLDLDRLVWLDPSGSRATLDTSACTLVFDRAIAIDKFIDRGATAPIGLGVIGMQASKLAAQLGKRADVDPDAEVINWQAPGLADGMGTTSLTAKTHAGKVIGLTVSGVTSATAIAALQTHLTALIGKPRPSGPDDASDDVVWKGKPGAMLTASGTTYRLALGDVDGPDNGDPR